MAIEKKTVKVYSDIYFTEITVEAVLTFELKSNKIMLKSTKQAMQQTSTHNRYISMRLNKQTKQKRKQKNTVSNAKLPQQQAKTKHDT